VLIGEATNTNFKVFGLIRTGFEPTIYLTGWEHASTQPMCMEGSSTKRTSLSSHWNETRSRSNIAEKIAYLEFKYILIRVYKKRFQAPVMFIIHPHGVGSNQFLSVNIDVIRLLSVTKVLFKCFMILKKTVGLLWNSVTKLIQLSILLFRKR
jgi:hypothetical protein